MKRIQLFSEKSKQVSGCLNIRRWLSTPEVLSQNEKCQVLIVGGGCGGCAMAAKLSSTLGKGKVTLLEPADIHYYQPMFTLIGGGMKRLEQAFRLMYHVLPKNAKWIKEKAVGFDPNSNTVTASSGGTITYDILLLASGLVLNYNKIVGLEEALAIPNGRVCSVYSPKYVEDTYEVLQRVKEGNAIFSCPATPIKCAGAPQKMAYISEHYFRRTNKRNEINVIYNTGLPVLFSAKYYADALWKVVKKRNINVNLKRDLIEVRPTQHIAVFRNLDKPDEIFEEEYSMLHAVPPMSPQPELSQCSELVNETGFVNVDKSTMQHVKYNNVFAIGDCSSVPTSKTAAAASAQSVVVYRNIMAAIDAKELNSFYDGYSSCPLVTGYNRCIIAEFDYNFTPMETFPMPQDKERYSMFFVKKELLPLLYWHIVLRGYWNGPSGVRKVMSVFKSRK